MTVDTGSPPSIRRRTSLLLICVYLLAFAITHIVVTSIRDTLKQPCPRFGYVGGSVQSANTQEVTTFLDPGTLRMKVSTTLPPSHGHVSFQLTPLPPTTDAEFNRYLDSLPLRLQKFRRGTGLALDEKECYPAFARSGEVEPLSPPLWATALTYWWVPVALILFLIHMSQTRKANR